MNVFDGLGAKSAAEIKRDQMPEHHKDTRKQQKCETCWRFCRRDFYDHWTVVCDCGNNEES